MEIEVNEMITSGKLIQLIYIFFLLKRLLFDFTPGVHETVSSQNYGLL